MATGHLGLGQGGHSPILHGLEHVLIQGGHLGTVDFNTYLDISGWEGHSVFNIYLDISGRPGQGGIVDRNTYFVGSGIGQGAGDNFLCGVQPQSVLGFSQTLQGHVQAGLGIWHVLHLHSHCFFGFWQLLQAFLLAKPSWTLLAFVRIARKYPPKKAIKAIIVNADNI